MIDVLVVDSIVVLELERVVALAALGICLVAALVLLCGAVVWAIAIWADYRRAVY